MSDGWICLYRSIVDNEMWQEKPFDKARAWIDLLLMANHQDKKKMDGNQIITVKRGSFITGELKLSKRWGWSRTKIRNFLKFLELEHMIIQQKDTKKTTITIVNYCTVS